MRYFLSEWRLHEPEAKFEHNFLSHWESVPPAKISSDGEKKGKEGD